MSAAELDRQVVKLGGSLLDWPRLFDALGSWLSANPARQTLLVVGGGQLVEAIRRLDALHSLGPEQAHWLSIDAMRISAAVVARRWGLSGLTCPAAIESSRGAAVIDPLAWMHQVEPMALRGRPLPHGWHVTSDSIAARLAQVTAADRLVLLKSAAAPSGGPEDWAAAGYVDQHFPVVAQGRLVQAVSLRDWV